MKGKLIIAPEYVKTFEYPVIFLAGPIQGAKRWQDNAVDIIRKYDKSVHIANPRRADSSYNRKKFSEKDYNEQVDWETSYLRTAGRHGTVLFWLAKEQEHNCARAYAQTTRFEIGEWKVRAELLSSKIALGIQKGYTGERYVRRRFSQDCPQVKIKKSLEETCKEAVKLCYRI